MTVKYILQLFVTWDDEHDEHFCGRFCKRFCPDVEHEHAALVKTANLLVKTADWYCNATANHDHDHNQFTITITACKTQNEHEHKIFCKV